MNKSLATLAAALIGLGALTAPSAQAAQQGNQPAQQGNQPAPQGNESNNQRVVIAQDTTQALTATPSAPRAIVIQAQPSERITISTKGERVRNVRANQQGLARVGKLTAGKRYTVRTSDASTTVTPVIKVGRANDLQVTTTNTADTVELTWRHQSTRARGGASIGYTVSATPVDSSLAQELTITDEVVTTSATLGGLDPLLRYSFSVTPHNAIGNGEPSTAVMDRSLSAITGIEVAGTPAPEPTEPTTPAQPTEPTARPSQPSSPGSRPAPAPRPATRTIYVCPDGFNEDAGVCKKTMGYTYQTQDYTYHRGVVGTETYTDTCSSGYTDANGQFHWVEQPHPCTRTRNVFGDIKNPTPAGWEDTGSNWRKKDDAPAGWMDDGSQWVQTTGKIEKVVPA